MIEFIVRRFNEYGVPETEQLTVTAEDEHEAAEKACGVTLTATVRPQIYCRADVRRVQRLNDHHMFYALPN
jgi:hypothetical protein